MPEESVKVAVRVRPFNQRELDRQAKLVIQMEGQMTSITNPEAASDGPKKFSFDYSYWSHDGFAMDAEGVSEPTPGSNYASQRKVFSDLGQGVLDNAFEGYNCSLFAYGQTGSGKSYSMVGYGPNKGIVPITCDELFKTMNSNSDPDKRYEVLFSMLEIYNEQVRDLLSKDNPKGGLNVRQNPKLGMFYVEGLKKVPVGSYKEIEKRMEQGTQSRTVASTNMNATSSRAHTVVTIVFDQILKTPSGETKKSSTMNLVDLAGSERADSTGATGDRLKEGANINRSLSALGNVISALADLSLGKKKVMVPYRDSVLTKLLQNALGGNSKTIMIAALSPADINFDETLSTLRYADRAKKIQNKAVINENPLDKLIRELKEENERLRKAMESGGLLQDASLSPEEREKMRRAMEEEIRAQFAANQELLAGAAGQESWNEKLEAARREADDIDVPQGNEKRRLKETHLINLNEDPMLSGVIVHFIADGDTIIGRKDARPEPNICLSGLSIQKQHAVLRCKNGVVELEPGTGSKIKVNGVPLTGKKTLTHKDRLLFGSNHLYVFMNPKKTEGSEDLPAEITWEFAQKEIAQVKGFATGSGPGLTKDQQIAQEQVLEILPMVSEVNAVSEELNKQKSFEVVLISAAAQEGTRGDKNAGTSEDGVDIRVMVKMKNLLNGNTWLWERGKFMNRRYLIQEMYQKWLDGEDLSNIPKEEDPFWEPTEDVLIGTANVFLQSLSYALDFDDKIAITDYKGQEEGTLTVYLTPCQQDGRHLPEEYFVEDPKELKGKPYYFKVEVRQVDIEKSRFSKGIKVKYRVYKDKEFTETPLVTNTLQPKFNHSKVFTFNKIKKDHLDFFESGSISFLVYGTQEDVILDAKLLKLTTRELRQMEHGDGPPSYSMVRRNTVFALETASDQSQLKTEVVLLQRKYERLAQKERRMQEVCKEWEAKPAEEQQFEPFYRVVSAVANSTGTRLKTRVQLLNQMSRLLGKVQAPDYEAPPKVERASTTLPIQSGQTEVMRLSRTASGNQLLPPIKAQKPPLPPSALVSQNINQSHSEPKTNQSYLSEHAQSTNQSTAVNLEHAQTDYQSKRAVEYSNKFADNISINREAIVPGKHSLSNKIEVGSGSNGSSSAHLFDVMKATQAGTPGKNAKVLKGHSYVRERSNQSTNNGPSTKSHNNDGDTISLFVFGEEELELASEAERNGGVVSYSRVAKHHYADLRLTSDGTHRKHDSSCLDEDRDSFESVDLAPFMHPSNSTEREIRSRDKYGNMRKSDNTNYQTKNSNEKPPRKIRSAEGGRKEGSSACSIQ